MSPSSKQSGSKVALVTGGSRGIGRAIVERLARDGTRVLFSYSSNAEAAAEVVEAVTAAGGWAAAVQADLSTLAGIESLFAQADEVFEREFGSRKFDFLVNNAGIIAAQKLGEVSEADFDRIFDLNVKGLFFVTQEAVARMRDGGRVINLGTGLTRIFMPERVVYSAAKGAVDVLTNVLAQQLGARGITVNTLAPGAIATDMNKWLRTAAGAERMREMTALKGVGYAEEIADVAAFLVSDDSRWVTAQRIEASGGQRL